MEFQSYFFLIFLGFIMCCSFCEANHTFYAGGKSGWILNPSESYSHWAERNRFQVNDIIGNSIIYFLFNKFFKKLKSICIFEFT